eukprot:CAMPEP_0117548530 /NCGR_PEP_ID=MMETSP0784-20121206/47697_1 /TAXON_ID=39447 /ORGANISM="" /LENGTH=171 /DNA_ID=CAMNT_0005345489 /DNA_START=121 /DNA_END=633 /DNA_ORIENTATION=-
MRDAEALQRPQVPRLAVRAEKEVWQQFRRGAAQRLGVILSRVSNSRSSLKACSASSSSTASDPARDDERLRKHFESPGNQRSAFLATPSLLVRGAFELWCLFFKRFACTQETQRAIGFGMRTRTIVRLPIGWPTNDCRLAEGATWRPSLQSRESATPDSSTFGMPACSHSL